MVEIFQTLIVQPVFNLLLFIYAIIPGHDFGIAIIIFTIIVRMALWPLLRKQLHHGRAMRSLQPELKKIKKSASGDRQKEMRLQMELYKERGIRPISGVGTLIIQLPIFIALYQAILKITNNPNTLVDFSYGWIRDFPWIHVLADDINRFDESFLRLVNLSQHGLQSGHWYFPAVVVAALSTFMQFRQTKLTMMSTQDSRKLSIILKEAASGKEADQAEVTAAVSKVMLFVLPVFTFIFALIVPAALSLYLLTSSTVGFFQTRHILGQDAEEMQDITNEKKPIDTKSSKKIVTKTTVTTIDEKKPTATKPKGKSGSKKKRRR